MRSVLIRALRSRKLAVALIATLTVYAILGTLVPQRGVGDPEALRIWAQERPLAEKAVTAVGFHDAYSSPLFLSLVALLAASTAACAWERTRRARSSARGSRALSSAQLDRLRDRPARSVPLGAESNPSGALLAAERTLREAGLRTRMTQDSVDGNAGRIGLWGSPLLHWSLVALILVVGIGRATRSQGFIALPLDDRVAEVHENYLQISEGALFGERHSAIEFSIEEVDQDYVADGVEYGATPLVVAYKNGTEIARSYVHPNSPLRIGSLMVHTSAVGPAVVLSLESIGGGEIRRETFTLDRSMETSSGTSPQEFTLDYNADEQPIKVRIQVLVRAKSPDAGHQVSLGAVLETTTVDSVVFGPPVLMAETEAMTLPGGALLRVADVKDWVLVSAINDWSVPVIYVLFALGILGLGLAALIPTRRASILLVRDAGGDRLHVGTWHSWGDPLYGPNIAEMIRQAVKEVA